MEQTELKEIVSKFAIKGTVAEIKPLGAGLINDTFMVTTSEEDQPNYVLQRINNAIFPDVEMLADNIQAVTTHIRKKLEEKGETDIDRKVLTFVPLVDGSKYFYFNGESYWRIMVFIPNEIGRAHV